MKVLKTIKKEKEKKICIIDGISFDYPKTFENYLELGFYTIMLVLTFPFWIWFYLAGRMAKGISRIEVKKETYTQLICPICSLPVIRGDYKQAKCHNCGWYEYTDDWYY